MGETTDLILWINRIADLDQTMNTFTQTDASTTTKSTEQDILEKCDKDLVSFALQSVLPSDESAKRRIESIIGTIENGKKKMKKTPEKVEYEEESEEEDSEDGSKEDDDSDYEEDGNESGDESDDEESAYTNSSQEDDKKEKDDKEPEDSSSDDPE